MSNGFTYSVIEFGTPPMNVDCTSCVLTCISRSSFHQFGYLTGSTAKR